jgi:hypothetical protein
VRGNLCSREIQEKRYLNKANKIIKKIKDAVGNWQKIADKYDIPKSERQTMKKAFRY